MVLPGWTPKAKCVGAPGLTLIVPLVPVIELVTVSVAVIVWLLAVFNVAIKVPVPLVKVLVLSLVMMLPKASSSATTGCVANNTPAVAVADGCVVTTSCVAVFGLTTILFDVTVNAPASVEKMRLMVSALL